MRLTVNFKETYYGKSSFY